jgi:hypothetical protein
MNKQQAMALLRLIADLYQIAETPDAPVEPEPSTNGATAREPVAAS